jgi:hypothetical protein
VGEELRSRFTSTVESGAETGDLPSEEPIRTPRYTGREVKRIFHLLRY